MAKVTQDINPTNDPNYLGYSQGIDRPRPLVAKEADTSAAVKVGAAADLVTAVPKGIDQLVDSSIKRTAREEVERIQGQEFGVDSQTIAANDKRPLGPGQGDNSSPVSILAGGAVKYRKGTPLGLQKSADEMSAIQDAYNAGYYSNTYYWSRMNALVRNMRAQYPGYEQEVDRAIAERTGGIPANKVRENLLADMDAAQRAAAAGATKDQTYVLTHAKYLGENAGTAVADMLSGQVPAATLMKIIVQRQGKEYEILSAKAESDANKEVAKNRDTPLSLSLATTVVTQTLNDTFYSGNFAGIADKLATGQPLDPEQKKEFERGMATVERNIFAQLTKRYQEAGFYKTVDAEDIQKHWKLAMAPWEGIKAQYYNQNYGVMGIMARENQRMEDASTNRLYTQFPALRDWGVVQKTIGPQMTAMVYAQAEKGEGGGQLVTTLVTDARRFTLQNTVVKPEPMKNVVPRVTDKLDTSQERSQYAYSTVSDHVAIIINPKATPDAVQKAATALYGPENKGFLPAVYSKEAWSNVYFMMTNPQVTAALQKGDPTTFLNYGTWAAETAADVVRSEGMSLAQSVKADGRFKIEYDPAKHELRYIPNVPDSKIARRLTSFYNKDIETKVGNINTVLKNLIPIIEASPGRNDVDGTIREIFAGAGIELPPVNPPSPAGQ